jgi:hypothetical protein
MNSPCRSIQYAVNLSNSYDVIYVAGGRYIYSGNNPLSTCKTNTITSSVVCIIDKHLTIIGGYSSDNWTNSDPTRNPTILDGENSYRVMGLFSTNGTTPRASLTLMNVTLQNGLAQGGGSGSYDYQISGYGGGLFTQNSPFNLENVNFVNNNAIGGNTQNSSKPYGGPAAGGGLSIAGIPSGYTSTWKNVTFENNQALGGPGRDRGGSSLGGGFYIYNAVVNAYNTKLANNIAHAGSSSGKGIDGVYNLNADGLGGGGVAHIASDVNLFGLVASGNRAIGGDAGSQSYSQAGHGHGGALFAENASAIRIYDAVIKENYAIGGSSYYGGIGGGAGLMTTNSLVVMERINIVANHAIGGNGIGRKGSSGGGGYYATRFQASGSMPILLENVIIADNDLTQGEGPGDPGGGGGGFWLQGVQIDILHSTIVNNRMDEELIYGAAAILVNFSTPLPTILNIVNSVVSDHVNTHTGVAQSAIHVWSGNTLNLNIVLFANNTNDTNKENDPYSNGGPGTINGLDTVLHTSEVGYYDPSKPSYDYHLSPSSPAIDQAVGSSTTVDIDGDTRPFGAQSDIGADEFTASTLVAQPELISLIADNNTNASYNVLVDTAPRSILTWTASTTANWIYLGTQGTSHQATGQAGEYLIIRFAPEMLNNGIHEAVVDITGDGVSPASINVRLTKVNQIFSVFLPLTIR